MQQYRGNGKLLLFGEYFVLKGAQSLAIPTQLGQTLTINPQEFLVKGLSWKSFDQNGKLWFEAFFDKDFETQHSTHAVTARTLQTILLAAKQLNPSFLNDEYYYDAHTHLEFPRDWGLGSSSTLIACIAQWTGVDAMELFFNSFTGSGYDIACAITPQPILYQLINEKATWKTVAFNPPFKNDIYFIHLGKKQNSRRGIQLFNEKNRTYTIDVSSINGITNRAISCTQKHEFVQLMQEHETIIANALEIEKVQNLYFTDFDGGIKSLGAWGGDFVMAVSNLTDFETKRYFESKGFATIVPYNKMILA